VRANAADCGVSIAVFPQRPPSAPRPESLLPADRIRQARQRLYSSAHVPASDPVVFLPLRLHASVAIARVIPLPQPGPARRTE
jgi:hypothetical protein